MKILRSALVLSSLISVSYSDDDCEYVLLNKDFEYGSYRIRKSGTYCLGENISLNPDYGSSDSPNMYGAWFPTDDHQYPGSIAHDDGGFALGFFCALCVEVSDVSIDLKGYEIEMSKPFYLQQRWFNLIEIQKTAFNFGQGPANFGQTVEKIQNIRITNGILGRSSHNGMHSFDVENIHVSHLKIHNFEVAGIQFNGFKDVSIHDVDIGPSATDVPFWGYYSHGRFSLNGFELIDEKDKKYIRFKGNRKLTLQEIYINLRDSLDIAYRAEMGVLTDKDKENPLYEISIKMFQNEFRVPDGSAIYGMVFNSKGLAVQGFGDSENEKDEHGNTLNIENVNINGLHLNMNEIPAVYFDRCEGHYVNEDGSTSLTPILGRFGDSFDVRRTLSHNKWEYMDNGFYSYSEIKYIGNPLSDAQIALNIFSDPFESNWGVDSTDDINRGYETFYRWATENMNKKYNSLPRCARFACNGDAMFHTNKGLIGIRLDNIENVMITNVKIDNLYNESPLGSLACGAYSGPSDGGQPRGLEKEGFMGADVKGISIIDGDMELYGRIHLSNFISSNGDVIGIHIMQNETDTSVYCDEPSNILFDNFECGADIGNNMYNLLKRKGLQPYPNNFYTCNVKAEKLEKRKMRSYKTYYTSNGHEHISPKGAIKPKCNRLRFGKKKD